MPIGFGSSIIPPLLFFLVFFAAFAFFEMLIVYSLNVLQKKYWIFVVDHLIAAKVHHKKRIQAVVAGSLIILLGIVWLFTPFFLIINQATNTIKILGLVLVAVMVAVYFITSEKITKTSIERDLFQYLYFVISIILYVALMMAADTGYAQYQNYINQRVVEPTAKTVQTGIESLAVKDALDKAREAMRKGECLMENYDEKENQGLIHFVYLTTDDEFIIDEPTEVTTTLNGWQCAGEKNLLITRQGKWYEVIRGEMPKN